MRPSHTALQLFTLGVLYAGTATLAAAQEARPGARAAGAVRLDVEAGAKASYRVREQLLGFNFPNDAVGTTQSVSGSLTIEPDLTFASGSKVSVDLRTMKSDDDRRDAYLRDRTIGTDRFPLAELVPRRVTGLTWPIPTSGKATFELVGNMTAHGVTAELSWTVDATFAADRIAGQAKTSFPFAKFGLTKPRLPGLLSVDDNIRLELDLRLRRTAAR